MKANTLIIRRVMNATLFVLLLASTKHAFAQNNVATLQHNDTITGVFYGQNALGEAHAAAVNGDVITLSSGIFSACEIHKEITIHGAGCGCDSLTTVWLTRITGTMAYYCNNVKSEGLMIDGVSFRNYLHNLFFSKCSITNCSTYNCRFSDFQFVNCVIKFLELRYFYRSSIINSVVGVVDYSHSDMYNPNLIYNSVVMVNDGVSIDNLNVCNSIIATSTVNGLTNCTFNNCINIKTGETSLFEGQLNNSNMEVDDYTDVFETFTGTIEFDNCYQLKEEIATSFLGNDETEVGLYGGMFPYSPRLSYMFMKHCNVAGRTDENKKLSVEIELLNMGE